MSKLPTSCLVKVQVFWDFTFMWEGTRNQWAVFSKIFETSISQHSPTLTSNLLPVRAHGTIVQCWGFFFFIERNYWQTVWNVVAMGHVGIGSDSETCFSICFFFLIVTLATQSNRSNLKRKGVLPLLYSPLISSPSPFSRLTDYVLAQVSSATPLKGKTESGWSQQPKLLPLGVQEASLHQRHSHPEQKSCTYSRLLTQAQLDCLSFAKHLGIKVLRK